MGVAKEITTALVKSTVQGKVRANPVRLTAMRAGAYQRGRHEAQVVPDRRQVKMMSFEVELAGLAVEFKAKRLQGMVTGLAALAALAAVLQELSRPRQFRTWHGRVAGIIPYDFRRPTFRRLLGALWAPDNPRLLTDTAFGIGWAINLAQLPRVLFSASRNARRHGHTYVAPRVSEPSATG